MKPPATVTVMLPRMLHDSIGKPRLKVRARTLREAFDRACEKYPALKSHVVDEEGGLRMHVLCFVNGENTRSLPAGDVPLKNGDEIAIVQAISGG